MSDLDVAPRERSCTGESAAGPVTELVEGRDVVLGGTRGVTVTRTLPARGRRMVGAWCFLDSYGPEELDGTPGMRVPPHPHTGLQTVSWLVQGEILHRDSVGSLQTVLPGQLNLMTAGRGISHSEESPPPRPEDGPRVLHGVQLWVALPDGDRHVGPHFEHLAQLPVSRRDGATVTVLMGTVGDLVSPAEAYSPLVGVQIALEPGARRVLPLRPDFEHAVVMMRGSATVAGTLLDRGPLLYLGMGRDRVELAAPASGTADGDGALALLIGGVPFDEEIVMWWNFVGRSHEEIVRYREAWEAEDRDFGTVPEYPGGRLAAPALPGSRLRPRGRER